MVFSTALNDTYTLFLLIILLVGLVMVSLYYGLMFLRVGCNKGSKLPRHEEVKASDLPSVSVVIIAHNEAEYLKESLPYLLEQDYPNYEVVVVDYTSHDDTSFVLRLCAENYSNLKPISFPEDVNMFRGKKYPLSIGIKSAKNDVILLTDPDCVPKDYNWIREMMCGYMRGASMVLGYGLVKQEKGLLNALQQYDNMAFNASYLGMALMGHPYTGSGHNLSYKRDFFFGRGGFISHYSIPDGADDLFVNQNATRSNTAVVLQRNAAVMVDSRPTFAMWHLERLHRHATRRYYGWGDKLMLAAYPLAQVLFWVSLILLLLGGIFPWQVLLGVVGVKLAWHIVSFYFLCKRFEVKTIAFFAPLFEIYFLFANTILFFFTLRKKNIRWR